MIFPTTSPSGTATMSGGWFATIVAELPRQDQLHRLAAEPGRERAVEGRRRATALQVAQHDVARFLPRPSFAARLAHAIPAPPSRSGLAADAPPR